MPFPIVFQVVARAFLWITLFSVESFAPALFKVLPTNNYSVYLAGIGLSITLFLALSYLEDEGTVRDLRDLCLYEVLAWILGLSMSLLGYKPTELMISVLGTLIFLRYGRLLWVRKATNRGSFAAWPVFGIFGWLAKRRGNIPNESLEQPTIMQKRETYAFIFLCLVAGFSLPQVKIILESWHFGLIAFLATPFIAKRTLADMKRQQAVYVASVNEAADERAKADAQREIALAQEKSNQLLAAKNAELEQANLEIQALLAEQSKDKALLEKFNHSLRDASHDLQHPMAVVRIHADALMAMSEEEFWNKEKWREVAQKLDFAMEEMTDMIDATVHSAQVVTGIIKPEVRVIDMDVLMKTFMMQWLDGPNRRGLDHLLAYPRIHPGLYCPFDLMILKRILRNLIANAIQHTPPNKGILLAVRRLGKRCVIEVRDSGPGIPEGLGKDKIANFAAFADRIREEGSQVRLNGGSNSNGSGYRLGMRNVLQLCAAMGLDMQLCAIAGRGSKFSFSLPLANPDQFTETMQMRNAIDTQWDEASALLEAYADLPMPEGDFFPEDDDLEYHKLMPSSPNGANGTPG